MKFFCIAILGIAFAIGAANSGNVSEGGNISGGIGETAQRGSAKVSGGSTGGFESGRHKSTGFNGYQKHSKDKCKGDWGFPGTLIARNIRIVRDKYGKHHWCKLIELNGVPIPDDESDNISPKVLSSELEVSKNNGSSNRKYFDNGSIKNTGTSNNMPFESGNFKQSGQNSQRVLGENKFSGGQRSYPENDNNFRDEWMPKLDQFGDDMDVGLSQDGALFYVITCFGTYVCYPIGYPGDNGKIFERI